MEGSPGETDPCNDYNPFNVPPEFNSPIAQRLHVVLWMHTADVAIPAATRVFDNVVTEIQEVQYRRESVDHSNNHPRMTNESAAEYFKAELRNIQDEITPGEDQSFEIDTDSSLEDYVYSALVLGWYALAKQEVWFRETLFDLVHRFSPNGFALAYISKMDSFEWKLEYLRLIHREIVAFVKLLGLSKNLLVCQYAANPTAIPTLEMTAIVKQLQDDIIPSTWQIRTACMLIRSSPQYTEGSRESIDEMIRQSATGGTFMKHVFAMIADGKFTLTYMRNAINASFNE